MIRTSRVYELPLTMKQQISVEAVSAYESLLPEDKERVPWTLMHPVRLYYLSIPDRRLLPVAQIKEYDHLKSMTKAFIQLMLFFAHAAPLNETKAVLKRCLNTEGDFFFLQEILSIKHMIDWQASSACQKGLALYRSLPLSEQRKIPDKLIHAMEKRREKPGGYKLPDLTESPDNTDPDISVFKCLFNHYLENTPVSSAVRKIMLYTGDLWPVELVLELLMSDTSTTG